jgi:hypothetical protein
MATAARSSGPSGADAQGPRPAEGRSPLERVRAALAALGATILGAAPHVLHHVGPLAGAAVLAGATGKLLFGAIGFVLAIPMLRRLRRRHRSWAVPGGVLGLMALVYTFSAFVIGPAVTSGGEDSSAPPGNSPAQTSPSTAPPGVSPSEHDEHH